MTLRHLGVRLRLAAGYARQRLKAFLVQSPTTFFLYSWSLELAAQAVALTGSMFRAWNLRMRALRARSATSIRRTDWAFAPERLDLSSLSEGVADQSSSQTPLLDDYLQSSRARRTQARFGQFKPDDEVRLRFPLDEENDWPGRQGDLMVVKRVKPDTGERGVLVVKYTDAMYRLPAIFDVAKLARDYRLVLEPSWWGYQDVVFLMYAEAGIQGVVQAPREPDFRFIEKLGGDLVPVAIGAGDWVDPADFSPRATQDRTFDLVMVSGWSPVKRHDLLCRALQSVREQCGRQLKAALVGYPQGWSRHEIESLLESYRVRHQCHIFENIKHKRVAEILGNSKLYLLLSSAEGANKALYEALFCDTPVIVYDRHRGVNHSHINSMTGLSFGKRPLTSTIIEALEGWESFDARAWALDHTGWQNSTKTVNRLLRRMAQEKEEPWTRDIDPKKNSPNLQYAEGNGPEKFAEEYDRLQSYLRTARSSSGLVY